MLMVVLSWVNRVSISSSSMSSDFLFSYQGYARVGQMNQVEHFMPSFSWW